MSTGNHQCSRCKKRFRLKKSAEAHIRQLHGGAGEILLYVYRHKADDDEPSMADRAVQAEIDRACGIPNDDIEWLLP
jgi:hypothetical protein